MKRICVVSLGLLIALTLGSGGMALAQGKNDFPKTGPATPTVPNASENYPLSYPGGAAPAAIAGALDNDDSTHNRVLTGCGGLSGVGTAVFYDTISITNTGAGTATFIAETSDQGAPGVCASMDTFLTAYRPTFNPASPATNCVAADDDAGPLACSRMTFTVPAGGTAVIVVSSFSNAATFPYQVNFTGTTPVELMKIKVE